MIDIAIYGGSCLILVSNFRFNSEDVDAVALEDQALLTMRHAKSQRDMGGQKIGSMAFGPISVQRLKAVKRTNFSRLIQTSPIRD